MPQVSGKIVSIAKNLQPGGRFKQGDFLAQIEKRDYQLALGQSRANAESAGVQLAIDRAQQTVAQKDWTQAELKRLGNAEATGLGPQRTAGAARADGLHRRRKIQ